MKIKQGDQVLIVSPDEKTYLVKIYGGKGMGTHLGEVKLGDAIGLEYGQRIYSNLKHPFLILEPTLEDRMMKLRRRTQIIYPKDAGLILLKCGLRPGMRVVECGTGSGALTMALANAVAPTGRVYTYDRREEHSANSRQNIENAGLAEFVEFKVREAQEGFDEMDIDVAIIDLPSPWDGIPAAVKALRGGGRIASLSPTYNQVERCVESLEQSGFALIETVELLIRTIRVARGKTRPVDRMIAHTGFLTFGTKALPEKKPGSEFQAP